MPSIAAGVTAKKSDSYDDLFLDYFIGHENLEKLRSLFSQNFEILSINTNKRSRSSE
jgi:hypothetical protein